MFRCECRYNMDKGATRTCNSDFMSKYQAKEQTDFINSRCDISLIMHLTNVDEIIELTNFIGNNIIQLHSDIKEIRIDINKHDVFYLLDSFN